MKFPLIVLSYGEFFVTKKLLIYTYNDSLIMPVFTDPELVPEFNNYMQERLNELGDTRILREQICINPSMALDMFTVISSIVPDLRTISINPTIKDGDIINNDITLENVIKDLQDLVSLSSK